MRAFFEGKIDAAALSTDLENTIVAEHDVFRYKIQDMEEFFQLRPEHLASLCDAVLADQIEPEHLETIAFCITASDAFMYDTNTPDGDLVGEVCSDWSAPEINYPLTKENVKKFRERLTTAKNPF